MHRIWRDLGTPAHSQIIAILCVEVQLPPLEVFEDKPRMYLSRFGDLAEEKHCYLRVSGEVRGEVQLVGGPGLGLSRLVGS